MLEVQRQSSREVMSYQRPSLSIQKENYILFIYINSSRSTLHFDYDIRMTTEAVPHLDYYIKIAIYAVYNKRMIYRPPI